MIVTKYIFKIKNTEGKNNVKRKKPNYTKRYKRKYYSSKEHSRDKFKIYK